jgi:hypothetical protein
VTTAAQPRSSGLLPTARSANRSSRKAPYSDPPAERSSSAWDDAVGLGSEGSCEQRYALVAVTKAPTNRMLQERSSLLRRCRGSPGSIHCSHSSPHEALSGPDNREDMVIDALRQLARVELITKQAPQQAPANKSMHLETRAARVFNEKAVLVRTHRPAPLRTIRRTDFASKLVQGQAEGGPPFLPDVRFQPNPHIDLV